MSRLVDPTRPLYRRLVLLVGSLLVYRPRWVLLAFTSIILVSVADTSPAQCPDPPPYVLFPLNWPCPVIPTCSTQSGVCLWPNPGAPGQPCYCQAPNGAWISGVIIRGVIIHGPPGTSPPR